MLGATALADKEQIHLTAAGQAAARAVVVQRADLGTAAAWAGGVKKPDLSSSSNCPTYKPKQSDLVVIGAAETDWSASGIDIDTQSDVLKTPTMVALDWQRNVTAPQVVPCVRAELAKEVQPGQRLVSFASLGFPKVTKYARAWRAVIDVKNGSTSVPVMIDIVLIGRGQTEITLRTTAPEAAAGSVVPAEVRLAELLVGRIRA